MTEANRLVGKVINAFLRDSSYFDNEEFIIKKVDNVKFERKKRPPLKETEVKELAERVKILRFDEGYTIGRIASSLKVSVNKVHYCLYNVMN